MPYREAEILFPCPRCDASLARDERGRRAHCLNGCGDYVLAAGIPELFGEDLQNARKSSMWWKASATSCPDCKAAMTAMTLGDKTFYRCGHHGLWFDGQRAGGAQLPQLVAAARHKAAREHRDLLAQDIERLLDGLLRHREDVVRELVTRLVTVEQRNRDLEDALAETREELADLRASRS